MEGARKSDGCVLVGGRLSGQGWTSLRSELANEVGQEPTLLGPDLLSPGHGAGASREKTQKEIDGFLLCLPWSRYGVGSLLGFQIWRLSCG